MAMANPSHGPFSHFVMRRMPRVEPPQIRSVTSEERCLIRFVNQTARTVDIIWINFTSQFVKYSLLQPTQFVDISTYKTHPWVAIDSLTKDRLHLNKEFVYLPESLAEYRARTNTQVPNNMRIIVLITIPLYSLYLRALLEVRNCLRKEEDVDSLDVTRHLKKELKKLIHRRNNSELTQ